MPQPPLFAAQLLFPLAITVAVRWHRLYDIDLVLNRAWLVAGATLAVGATYVALVTPAGTALNRFLPALLVSAAVRAGRPPWPQVCRQPV